MESLDGRKETASVLIYGVKKKVVSEFRSLCEKRKVMANRNIFHHQIRIGLELLTIEKIPNFFLFTDANGTERYRLAAWGGRSSGSNHIGTNRSEEVGEVSIYSTKRDEVRLNSRILRVNMPFPSPEQAEAARVTAAELRSRRVDEFISWFMDIVHAGPRGNEDDGLGSSDSSSPSTESSEASSDPNPDQSSDYHSAGPSQIDDEVV